jgi:predicted transcriptional regulator of viral defense system
MLLPLRGKFLLGNNFARGVICLISALAFHRMTTQVPHAVFRRQDKGFQVQDGVFPVGYHGSRSSAIAIQVQNPGRSVNEEGRSDFFRDCATDRSVTRESIPGGQYDTD